MRLYCCESVSCDPSPEYCLHSQTHSTWPEGGRKVGRREGGREGGGREGQREGGGREEGGKEREQGRERGRKEGGRER